MNFSCESLGKKLKINNSWRFLIQQKEAIYIYNYILEDPNLFIYLWQAILKSLCNIFYNLIQY